MAFLQGSVNTRTSKRKHICFANNIQYIGFIGGGNRRKPPICRKSLTNLHNVVSNTSHHEWDSNSQLSW